MNKLEIQLVEAVKTAFKQRYSIELDENLIQLQATRKDFEGDLTFACLTFCLLPTTLNQVI